MYALVDDNDLYYNVLGVYPTLQKSDNPRRLNYLVTDDVYEYVENLLNNNKKVNFLKLDKFELTCDDVFIDVDDLTLFKTAKIEQIKNNFAKGISSNKRHGASIEFACFAYQLTLLINEFYCAGITFSDDRHDTYLQILETEDDNLIDKLEEYLELYDEIMKRSSMLHRLYEFETRMLVSESEREVESLAHTQISYAETEL